MARQTVTINLNDQATFVFNDNAREIWARHLDSIGMTPEQYPLPYKMQLHEFMFVFGKYMYMGNIKLPIDTLNIQLEVTLP